MRRGNIIFTDLVSFWLQMADREARPPVTAPHELRSAAPKPGPTREEETFRVCRTSCWAECLNLAVRGDQMPGPGK